MYSLVDAHSVVNVIFLVSNKRLSDTWSSFQEAENFVKLIIDSTLSAHHLEPLEFLT